MSVKFPIVVPPPQNDQERIFDAVGVIAESRAVIDQTKGMLMLVYGIDADQAFAILRWQSQQHNVKLRVIATRIAADLVALSKTDSVKRMTLDGLLLTAHHRVAAVSS